MAYHCGAPTRDGSACERHVREQGMRCHQHRNPGGAALLPPRLALRTIPLEDPALTAPTAGWMSVRDEIAAAHAAQWDETTDSGLPRRTRPRPPAKIVPNKPVAPSDEGAQAILNYLLQRKRDGGENGVVDTEPDERHEPLEAEHGRADRRQDEPQVAEPRGAGRRAQEPRREPSAAEPDQPDRRREAQDGDQGRADRSEPEPRREPFTAEADRPDRRPEPVVAEPEAPGEAPRPLFRDERDPAPDPDWIGARPLFRDEAPTRVQPRVEAEPASEAPAPKPARQPRIAPLKSVVLNPQPEPEPAPDPDPPTLIQPEPDPDPPTLIEPLDQSPAPDLAVPDFVVPGFAEPAPKPPLRTVLSTVLGPELWQRCYVEWGAAHCTALARVARGVDGLAPSASAALRSTAGASMRWLGVNREREELADLVAAAISHPVGATDASQARTVRLYGAAICMALNIPMRRCACHRDLDRDVSSELIRLGLEELAGEVP